MARAFAARNLQAFCSSPFHSIFHLRYGFMDGSSMNLEDSFTEGRVKLYKIIQNRIV